jgi:hypothetical protein
MGRLIVRHHIRMLGRGNIVTSPDVGSGIYKGQFLLDLALGYRKGKSTAHKLPFLISTASFSSNTKVIKINPLRYNVFNGYFGNAG